jgi:iron(III) transport system substrate-binding protein
VSVVDEQPNQRILSERRAGKYLADVVIGGSSAPLLLYGAGALDPIKSALTLPEVVDESKWREGKHRYLDSENRYIFMYDGHPQTGGISYNRNLVNPGSLHSLWDFIDPKWKGKIEARDIRSPGSGGANMRFFYYSPTLGPKFITRLFKEMDVTLFRDRRQSVDWLASGKFAICFFCVPSEIGRAESQGLPVGRFGLMKEGAGLYTHSGVIGLLKNTPHPNATKVFINWLLSREGQITFQNAYVKAKVGVANSLREDIPKDSIPVDQRLVKGVNYLEVDTPERMSMGPIYKVFNEALPESEKR